MVPTNNASFIGSSEAAQQLAQGRVQAVTHGRAVVQVSTVGVTAVISPRGVVTQEARPYTRAYLVADVPLRRGLSVADRLGPWPARVVLAAATVLVLAGAAPARAGAIPARAGAIPARAGAVPVRAGAVSAGASRPTRA